MSAGARSVSWRRASPDFTRHAAVSFGWFARSTESPPCTMPCRKASGAVDHAPGVGAVRAWRDRGTTTEAACLPVAPRLVLMIGNVGVDLGQVVAAAHSDGYIILPPW